MIIDAQVDAAMAVLLEAGVALPYGADASYYVSVAARGEERKRQFAALQAADRQANERNRKVVRKALEAGLTNR